MNRKLTTVRHLWYYLPLPVYFSHLINYFGGLFPSSLYEGGGGGIVILSKKFVALFRRPFQPPMEKLAVVSTHMKS